MPHSNTTRLQQDGAASLPPSVSMSDSSLILDPVPEGHQLVHREEMAIRWGDMDAMMHVNNTVYFRFMEQARISWVDSWGVGNTAEQTEGPVIATASCRFRRPLKYPGTVEIRVFSGRIGRSSLPTYYEIRRTDEPQTLYATGDALFVWISNVTGKPVSFPPVVRERLGQKP